MARYYWICSTLLLILLFSTTAYATTPKPIRVILKTPESQLASGESIQTNVTVNFQIAVEAVNIRVISSGSVRTPEIDEGYFGPWQPGANLDLQLLVAPAGLGEGSVTIQAFGVDIDGTNIASGTRVLYALVEKDDTWVSTSSLTDARIKKATRLHESATGLAFLQSAGPSALTTAMDEIATSRVKQDNFSYPERPMTVHEKRLQQSLSTTSEVTKLATAVIAPAAAVNITVKGRAQWTDSSGNLHPIPMASVEIHDDDLIGSNLITTLTTDAKGDYNASFTHDDGIGAGNPDIFVRVFARSAVADIKPDAVLSSTYRLESPVENEVASGTTLTVNLTAGNSADGETVFSVHHAMVVIGAYAGGLAGSTPSQVTTFFPTTESTSMFKAGNLHILQPDRWDWDVIHHEYGHYFMNIHGFVNNPGGSHSGADNLAQTTGSKDKGIRLAWGEGWPTYFAISGQQVSGSAALNIANVGDTFYTDTEDSTLNRDQESSTGIGEDNEVSVSTVLWDLYDTASDGADQISLGDKKLFDAFKSASPKHVGTGWEAIAASQNTRDKIVVGAVFGQSNIAPELIAPVDNINLKASDPPPKFEWEKNGGGIPNPLNDFTIKFYNNDFSSIIFEKDLGDTDNYTPTTAELATILGGDTIVKWVIEGSNTSTPATSGGALGKYWSGSRTLGGINIGFVIDDTGSMFEEIGGVKSALQTFIDSVAAGLPSGTPPPTMQLITFKDNVNHRLTTNDLDAMRGNVASLFASGGGDCPEYSAQALQFAAENIAPGGTILLATDASSQPGVDIGAVISELTAKGVTVNTILSGDCSGIASSGFSTLAAKSADTLQESGVQGQNKPGDVDEPQVPIVDPGQAIIDEHGNTTETATSIIMDGNVVRGTLDSTSDTVDYFSFQWEAGKTYAIGLQLESGSSASFMLLDRDGMTFLKTAFAFSSSIPTQIVYTPLETGTYYLKANFFSSGLQSSYLVSVKEDPFAVLDTALTLFSTVSAQTGGVFVVRDDVNFGAIEEYVAAVLNILKSTVEPTVLSANPDKLPQGTTLAVIVNGRGTNWRAGSSVSFPGSGIAVQSVEVASATSLTALLQIEPAAALGFRDVIVTTPLGASTELSTGLGIVEVVSPITTPTLLSVEPSIVSQGQTLTATIRGVNTNWDANSEVSLGGGINVESVSILSPNLIQVQANVAANAAIGFRTASVNTPGEGSQSKIRSLFINSSIVTLPQITKVVPNEGVQGHTMDVLVRGINTHFEDGITTAVFGSGINILTVNVIDSLSATVEVDIANDAAPGFRNINLVTGAETAVLLNGFFVDVASIPGDVDGDGDVDRDDLNLVVAARNMPAQPGDPRDLDEDGVITALDARLLILLCTRSRCATE